MISTTIRPISLERLVPHPGNPNRMSRANLGKLARTIELTGRYEPLVVRPCPGRRGFFQIINGHHRCEALRALGHKTAEAVVWNVDDEQTDLLLATLNRLHGRDTLEKKQALLRRLSGATAVRKLAKLLPHTHGQLERLVSRQPPARAKPRPAGAFAIPLVFFVDPAQEHAIEEALARACAGLSGDQPRAARRAMALTSIAKSFLDPAEISPREEPSAVPAGP